MRTSLYPVEGSPTDPKRGGGDPDVDTSTPRLDGDAENGGGVGEWAGHLLHP